VSSFGGLSLEGAIGEVDNQEGNRPWKSGPCRGSAVHLGKVGGEPQHFPPLSS
jgi:hypothetical protein